MLSNANDKPLAKTPATEAEVAGKADSADGAKVNIADSAMKQTSKTDAERGDEQADENRADPTNQQR